MMKKLIFALIFAVLAVPCTAEIITIDANVTGDYPTIQAAIDDANDGDTIILLPGIYTGDGNRDIDYLGKAITVRSTDPNDPNIVETTVIDCNRQGRGFYFRNEEEANSILAGITIKNGLAPIEQLCNRNIAMSFGGGIFCYGSSPTITRCHIEENRVGMFGGYSMSWFPIIMVYYTGGGGIGCFDSNSIITYCKITNNKCNAYFLAYGGGVYCYGGKPTIQYCNISDNHVYGEAGGMGGGILCNNGSVINCQITGNSVNRRLMLEFGGGIYCWGDDTLISNCLIADNFAQCGGGIFSGDGLLIYLGSCIESNNSSENISQSTSDYGMDEINLFDVEDFNSLNSAGMFWDFNSTPTIVNCTIIENTGAGYGGGIYCDINSIPRIKNCIIRSNTNDSIYGDANATYSLIQGGYTGMGNIDADPCFVDADANDYHLSADSGCIDAGDPNTDPNVVGTVDLDGNERFIDGDSNGDIIIDMGAYEADWPFVKCPYWALGDLNGDGYVGTGDVSPIINYFGQPASACPAADVDKDGWINGNDVIPIINNFGEGDGAPCP